MNEELCGGTLLRAARISITNRCLYQELFLAWSASSVSTQIRSLDPQHVPSAIQTNLVNSNFNSPLNEFTEFKSEPIKKQSYNSNFEFPSYKNSESKVSRSRFEWLVIFFTFLKKQIYIIVKIEDSCLSQSHKGIRNSKTLDAFERFADLQNWRALNWILVSVV